MGKLYLLQLMPYYLLYFSLISVTRVQPKNHYTALYSLFLNRSKSSEAIKMYRAKLIFNVIDSDLRCTHQRDTQDINNKVASIMHRIEQQLFGWYHHQHDPSLLYYFLVWWSYGGIHFSLSLLQQMNDIVITGMKLVLVWSNLGHVWCTHVSDNWLTFDGLRPQNKSSRQQLSAVNL